MIRRTSWRRFFAAAALLGIYSLWSIAGDSPLRRAKDALGSLPELTPGFHPGEPAATLSRLGAARVDYLWMQVFDLLFVALAAMTALLSLALFSRRPATPISTARRLTFVPCAFIAAGLAENALLSLFASGAIATSPALAFVQQTATTLKLALAALTVALSFSFIGALGGARSQLEGSR